MKIWAVGLTGVVAHYARYFCIDLCRFYFTTHCNILVDMYLDKYVKTPACHFYVDCTPHYIHYLFLRYVYYVIYISTFYPCS